MAPDEPLRLRAEDSDDLAVISAVAQDALISVKDLTYDRENRRFTAIANRFRWEQRGAANGAGSFERTHCALSFEAVERVGYRGFRRSGTDRILSLLALRVASEPRPGKPGTIELDFSEGATVRLTVAALQVRAADIGEPWPTAWQPDHATDDPR